MTLTQINTEVRRLIREAQSANSPESYFKSKVRELFQRENLNGQFQDEILKWAESEFNFVSDKTMPATERKAMTEVFKICAADFATVQDKIQNKLVNEMAKGFAAGKSVRELQVIVDSKFSSLKVNSRTIAETATKGFSGVARIEDAKKLGVNKLKLVGPPPERPWCIHNLNQIKTIEEWSRSSNGQGLPVLYFAGGYRCKHQLIPAD